MLQITDEGFFNAKMAVTYLCLEDQCEHVALFQLFFVSTFHVGFVTAELIIPYLPSDRYLRDFSSRKAFRYFSNLLTFLAEVEVCNFHSTEKRAQWTLS